MGIQMSGRMDLMSGFNVSGDWYELIINIIETLPCADLVMALVLITMIAFYATSFDSIALTASCYCYKRLEEGEQPHRLIQLMWCILLIVFPIALVFSESSMNNLQSVSIIAAFPIGVVIVMITISFIKDASSYIDELKDK
jgi:BCCT family betaine/carnitine transporter